jgi:tRNA G18 (ribose-2'-O)-methylase SpoU
MRGFFAIGAERISKPMNLGALMRTGHAFGASFVFSINAPEPTNGLNTAYLADTSHTADAVPYYAWASLDDMQLPQGCQLVGVELTEEAVLLPQFRHPLKAAYIMGPEKGNLSAGIVARCDHVVKIPTRFCINVSLAGALVMYDRHMKLGSGPAGGRIPAAPG